MNTLNVPAGSSHQASSFVGPLVIGVRGPSRSGKTTLCELLVSRLNQDGLKVAWIKRTHHEIDLAEKSSGRIWSRHPGATLLLAADRMTLTTPPCDEDPAGLVGRVPHDTDVVLFETHTPVDFPSVVSANLEPGEGEQVIARWSFGMEAEAVQPALASIRAMMPADREFDHALRAAMRLHGGRGCAGLILGARLALRGARELGLSVPDTQKRLIVWSETDRCAVDAIQAVTGCRPGKRTLRLLDYGKLAATFRDEASGRAVRVAVRGDLRSRVGVTGPGRHDVQREAYATWPDEALFRVSESSLELDQFDRPGPPRQRVECVSCGEEVSDGRQVETELGPRCRSCV